LKARKKKKCVGAADSVEAMIKVRKHRGKTKRQIMGKKKTAPQKKHHCFRGKKERFFWLELSSLWPLPDINTV